MGFVLYGARARAVAKPHSPAYSIHSCLVCVKFAIILHLWFDWLFTKLGKKCGQTHTKLSENEKGKMASVQISASVCVCVRAERVRLNVEYVINGMETHKM